MAIKRYSKDYVYASTNYGKSFDLICRNELNEWGCLKGSRDLSTMILTDVNSRNVHVSEDYGKISLVYILLSLLLSLLF